MFRDRFFKRHLEDEEEILLLVHKHWLIGWKDLFLPSLAIITLFVVALVAPVKPVILTVVVIECLSVIWFLRSFFDYYLDAWIITNTGIIDVEWHGWFHRESSRVLYSDINGVSYEIKGIYGTLLRNGLISIEKISTGNEISMPYVKNPKAIEALILKNMEKYLHKKNFKDASQLQDLLVNVLAKEMQLKDLESKKKPAKK